MHRAAMANLHSSDVAKAAMRIRKGQDDPKKMGLRKVTPASEDELLKVSAAMRKYHSLGMGRLEPALRNWFGLFRFYDTNFDAAINYLEFKRMVRDMLRVPKNEVGDRALMAAWHALDEDKDGLLTAGQFGRFFRRADINDFHNFLHTRKARARGRPEKMYIKVGIVSGVARDNNWRTRGALEASSFTPMQEARIEARKIVKRWGEEEKLLQDELKKVHKEEKKLERSLSSRGALRSVYGSSLAASRSASRLSLASMDKESEGDGDGDED